MKRAFAILIAIIASMFVNLAPASADDILEVYHRSYSAIPTVRVWDYYGYPNGGWRDQKRGEYAIGTPGHYWGSDIWLHGGSIYVPVGYCLEDNIYNNNVFQYQLVSTGGNFHPLGQADRFHSVTIYDPGADNICN